MYCAGCGCAFTEEEVDAFGGHCPFGCNDYDDPLGCDSHEPEEVCWECDPDDDLDDDDLDDDDLDDDDLDDD